MSKPNTLCLAPWTHTYLSPQTERRMCFASRKPAQELVITRLISHEFSSKYRAEILRIVQFIKNGAGSDGQEFLQKMQITSKYRESSFSDSHNEIAKAMGYGR